VKTSRCEIQLVEMARPEGFALGNVLGEGGSGERDSGPTNVRAMDRHLEIVFARWCEGLVGHRLLCAHLRISCKGSCLPRPLQAVRRQGYKFGMAEAARMDCPGEEDLVAFALEPVGKTWPIERAGARARLAAHLDACSTCRLAVSEVARATEGEDRLPVATRVGDYEIVTLLGRGSGGTVYGARHVLIEKSVAIKVLDRSLQGDPAALSRFIHEARAVNQVCHANLVDVFGFGELPDGRPYLVMEWLRGMTLRERLAQGALAEAEAAGALVQLACGLEAAHRAGIVHRDLKPENVFLCTSGAIKILDFGLAKVLAGRAHASAHGAFFGTPLYAAPEQARGTPIDARADLYSLGVVAFELLVGHPPFQADHAVDILKLHLDAKPPSPLEAGAKVGRETDWVVRQLMAKEPNERPTLPQVIDVFGARQTALPIAQAPKWRRWMPAALVLAVAASGWAWHRRSSAPRSQLPAVTQPVPVPARAEQPTPDSPPVGPRAERTLHHTALATKAKPYPPAAKAPEGADSPPSPPAQSQLDQPNAPWDPEAPMPPPAVPVNR
jgi:serine/threonine-protein kinase